MRARPKYTPDGDWCLVQYKEPMLLVEIDEAKLVKAVSRKMRCAMILDWHYISDDGLIEAIDFLRRGA